MLSCFFRPLFTLLPPCDIPSGCCFFTGPWTVTRSSLRMLRRVAAFCRPLRPVLLLVSFPRSRSPVVGVPGLCWMWRDVPFAPPPPGIRRATVREAPAGASTGVVAYAQRGGGGGNRLHWSTGLSLMAPHLETRKTVGPPYA